MLGDIVPSILESTTIVRPILGYLPPGIVELF